MGMLKWLHIQVVKKMQHTIVSYADMNGHREVIGYFLVIIAQTVGKVRKNNGVHFYYSEPYHK